MHDGTDSEISSEQGVENYQSCPQPDTELQAVTGTSTVVSECQNCADNKTKLGRLWETYRKLKFSHRKLRKEACQLQQMCNSQVPVLYVIE